jgi:hypothetical protein
VDALGPYQALKSFNLLVGVPELFNIIPDGNNFVDFSRPLWNVIRIAEWRTSVDYKNIGGFFSLKPCLMKN